MEIYTTTQTVKKCPYSSHVLIPPNDVHKATFFVLSFVEKGEATIEFYNKEDSEKKTVTVIENTCFFSYPFVAIRFINYSKDLSYRNIIVSERVMMDCCNFFQEGLYDELLNLEYPPVFHISPPSIIYFAECASALEGAKKSDKKDIAHRSLVCSLLNQYLVSKSINNIFPKWINGFLRNLEDEDFLSKSVEEMVRTTNYSHGYVNREFKRYIGCSIKQFIIRKKLDRATVLLTTTDSSIEDIADILNFGNASNLIIIFKKRYGLTPAKYRKLYGSSIQIDVYQEWGDIIYPDK